MSLSIIIPALNEAHTIAKVIHAAQQGLQNNKLQGEIIIANNNSIDQTEKIARSLGAQICLVTAAGYGNVLRQGISSAQGDIVIIGDADCSYDFANISIFIEKLSTGYDFVIGNRFQGVIEPGAMPFLHRFLGTPVLTMLVNLLFGTHIHDINCGLRGFTKKAFLKMNCQSTGMEIASEMVINAARHKLKIAEVPCNLYKDQRNKPPHLQTWRDGWRHLKLILRCYFADHFITTGAA